MERDLSDGTKIGMCKRGWSIFFATMRKKGWDEKKSMPEVNETAFLVAVEETKGDFLSWWFNKKKSGVYPYTQVGAGMKKPVGGVAKGTRKPVKKKVTIPLKGMKDASHRLRQHDEKYFNQSVEIECEDCDVEEAREE